MQTLCVIPARGSSKRVPRKNVLPLAGKPCLEYAIDTVREARSPLSLVVLTDDAETARIAASRHVQVVHEPDVLARDDHSTETDTLLFAAEAVDPLGGRFDLVLIQYACVPIKPAGVVDRLVEFLRDTGADMVQTATQVDTHTHPYRLVTRDSDGRMRDLVQGAAAMMSQDFPAYFRRTGAGFAIRRDTLSRVRGYSFFDPRFDLDRRCLLHGSHECVDIDSADDVLWAEFLLHRRAEPSLLRSSSAIPGR